MRTAFANILFSAFPMLSGLVSPGAWKSPVSAMACGVLRQEDHQAGVEPQPRQIFVRIQLSE
eukprot:4471834-Pyramimonas_sp.AAC.1